jgi:hypothetical protein
VRRYTINDADWSKRYPLIVDAVSKKLDAPYRSGPSKIWIKIKNQKESAATRVVDGTF